MSAITRPDTAPLSFEERFLLAMDRCAMVYEERDGFLSDDNVIDITDEFTTDLHPSVDDDWDRETPDRDRLAAALFAALTPPE